MNITKDFTYHLQYTMKGKQPEWYPYKTKMGKTKKSERAAMEKNLWRDSSKVHNVIRPINDTTFLTVFSKKY